MKRKFFALRTSIEAYFQAQFISAIRNSLNIMPSISGTRSQTCSPTRIPGWQAQNTESIVQDPSNLQDASIIEAVLSGGNSVLPNHILCSYAR